MGTFIFCVIALVIIIYAYKWVDKKEKQIKAGTMPKEEVEKWAKAGEKMMNGAEGVGAVSSILGGIVGFALVIYAISVLVSL